MKRIVCSLVSVLLLTFNTATLQAASPRQCTRKTADHLLACIDTLVAMRSVQTAVEAYAIDHGRRYSQAHSMAQLRDLVQPTYFKTMPLTDAWGTEFRYLPTPDGKSYRLVSAASDKNFDESSWSTPGLLESSKEDAVVSSDADGREWVIQE
jgi:hypothetical protein